MKLFLIQQSRALMPLLLAVTCAHLQCMDQLMKQREIDNSRLVIAAQNGDVAMARLLLTPPASVNAVFTEKQGTRTVHVTPLRQAVQNNHLEMLKLLLECKANPNQIRGETPLFIATCAGHTQAAQLLLAANADPNAADDGRVSPLMLASQNGNLPLVESLIQAKAEVNNAVLGFSALHQTAHDGNIPIMIQLLRAKANPNLKTDDTKNTPLFVASVKGHTQAALLLLGAHADPNGSNFRRCSSLQIAAEAGNNPLIKALIQAKASVDICAKKKFSGTTALSQAAQNGHAESVKLLLAESDATINKPRTDGATPLHLAVDFNHASVVEVLVAAGASTNAVDKKGKCPADYAQNQDMLALLQRTPAVKTE